MGAFELDFDTSHFDTSSKTGFQVFKQKQDPQLSQLEWKPSTDHLAAVSHYFIWSA